MSPEQISKLIDLLASGGLSLVGVLVGALLGYWLGGAREAAKIRREHQRAIRIIQAAYQPYRHSDSVAQIDAWWPLAIDDYGRFKRWRLDKLRSRFRDIPTFVPDWNISIESEYTPEREARQNKQLAETREHAMVLFERLIETL